MSEWWQALTLQFKNVEINVNGEWRKYLAAKDNPALDFGIMGGMLAVCVYAMKTTNIDLFFFPAVFFGIFAIPPVYKWSIYRPEG